MELFDIIRRWHDGATISAISRNLSRSRKTIRGYIKLAREAGISREEPLPAQDELLGLLRPLLPDDTRVRPAQEELEKHMDELRLLLTREEDPLKPKTAFQVLQARYEIETSYSTYKRFVRAHRHQLGLATAGTTCRIEVPPGSEVQVDYGHMGHLFDAQADRRRVVYAFIGTLSYSRHKYVEFTFSQRQESFVGSHRRMFEQFGGVPRRINCDNLKSGVLKPDYYDPELNPLYREMAHHYGCFIDPARVARPRDKGKVERAVPVVRELFRRLKELHGENMTLAEANAHARRWCLKEDGERIHGTTKERPVERFERDEAAVLDALPDEPFEVASWKQVTVHADQYVQFEKVAYSVPARYVGECLWARGTERTVQFYDLDYRLVKTHVRTERIRQTDLTDFPERVQAALAPVEVLLAEAADIGERTVAYLDSLLEPGTQQSRRKARAVLRLANTREKALIECAAKEAAELEIARYEDFVRLVDFFEDAQEPEETPPISAATASLMRSASYFTHSR